MDLGEWVWADLVTVAVAWFTVVGLLLSRVPKPPSLLDSSLDAEDTDNSEPLVTATPHGRFQRFLPKPRVARHPKAKRLDARQ